VSVTKKLKESANPASFTPTTGMPASGHPAATYARSPFVGW